MAKQLVKPLFPIRQLVDLGFQVAVLEADCIDDEVSITATIIQPETENDAAQSMVIGYTGLAALREHLSGFLDNAEEAADDVEVLRKSLDKDVA
jgi:hypothetical protein